MNSDEKERGSRGAARWLWLAPLLLAAVTHRGVLNAEFAKDDFLHLYQLANTDALTFLTTPHGGHLYYARNAYLWLLHALFGDDPRPYFAVVLALHLVNVALLGRVLRGLTGRIDWSLFGAALWGLSPPLLGALGWVSAHGYVLVVTCLLWVLDDVVRLRARGRRPPAVVLARWFALLLAASSSSGVGLGVAMAFCFALPLLWNDPRTRRAVAWPFATLLVLLPVLYVVQYGWHKSGGDLTLAPAGGLADTLRLTLSAATYAVGSGLAGGLAACNYPQAEVVAGPWAGAAAERVLAVSVAPAILLLALLALHAWRGRRRVALEASAFLVLALAYFGMIGVGRAGYLAARGIPIADVATWPRYHYAGELLVIAAAVILFARRGRPATPLGAAALAAWLAAVGLPSYQASREVTRFVPTGGQAEYRDVQNILRREIARAPGKGPIILRNHPLSSIKLGQRSALAFPGRAAVFVMTFPRNEVDGRRVYFIERKQEVLARARADPTARSATLLISPAERKDVVGG